MVIQGSCEDKLPALCYSTPTATTDLDRTVRNTTKLTLASDNYILAGYRNAQSFRFLGIAFANPPLMRLRFAPLQTYSGPNKVDVTKMADS
ncbi:hypothetical protein N7457_003841 [Penicillium paradoxum]|uniref:uncharacterized protein n=1 Tax=Penicillium paradoxum TaxID=176176 RepID=UPI0025472F84|nr:uncharacterized protein N7457_003841 [Penicillium paradoxum]KAJ5782067.1 hypothetical protein N7457_003841 [Penicillium paradoxum]